MLVKIYSLDTWCSIIQRAAHTIKFIVELAVVCRLTYVGYFASNGTSLKIDRVRFNVPPNTL